MKNLLLLFLLLISIGCHQERETGPDNRAEDIIGTWTSDSGVYYSFSSDRTGEVGDLIEGEEILWWSIKDDSLLMVIELQPDTTKYKINFQTKRTLVLNNTFKFRKR